MDFLKRLLMLCTLLLAITSFGASQANANALPVWEWAFDDPVQVLGPTDIVYVDATITNTSPSGGPHLLGTDYNGGGVSANTFHVEYDGDFGTPTTYLHEEFTGMDLAPGDSWSFVHYNWTPIGGSVPYGTYTMPSANLQFSGVIGWVSNGPFEVTVVPEPTTMLLLGTGLVGLVGFRKKLKK